jgi:drug/metabolite transporter (DMT)-like permease
VATVAESDDALIETETPLSTTTTAARDEIPSSSRTSITWQVKFVLLAAICGSNFLFMKVGLQSFSPVQVATFRLVVGAAVLFGLLHLWGGRLPHSVRGWWHPLVAGGLLATLPCILFVASTERVSSALAGIGSATTPLFAALFGFLLVPHDRPAPSKMMAVLAGFTGVVIIMEPWQSMGRPDALGFGMSLAAAASWALGWAYYCRFMQDGDAGDLSVPTALLVAGAGLMLPVLLAWWWLNRDAYVTPWSGHTAGEVTLLPVLAVLVLGVVGTAIAYAFQLDVVRGAGATVGASITYLVPVVSVALGVGVLGEYVGGPQLVGAAIGVTAVAVIGLPTRGRGRGTRALRRPPSPHV